MESPQQIQHLTDSASDKFLRILLMHVNQWLLYSMKLNKNKKLRNRFENLSFQQTFFKPVKQFDFFVDQQKLCLTKYQQKRQVLRAKRCSQKHSYVHAIKSNNNFSFFHQAMIEKNNGLCFFLIKKTFDRVTHFCPK